MPLLSAIWHMHSVILALHALIYDLDIFVFLKVQVMACLGIDACLHYFRNHLPSFCRFVGPVCLLSVEFLGIHSNVGSNERILKRGGVKDIIGCTLEI